MSEVATLDGRAARRLALACAGLLKPEWTGLPRAARGGGPTARAACHAVIQRFGYLQLDTVSVAGARSHALVLMSRFETLDPRLAEDLLKPGEPLFEYWGHEACWLPMELYPIFEFRRQQHKVHPWWGDLLGKHPDVAESLMRRIENEGALRSVDFEGRGGAGWWNLKLTKKIATALWSSGELAISQRRNFQRVFDLSERVIPPSYRDSSPPFSEALEELLLLALAGHGWATTGTLAATWRLRNLRSEIAAALDRLQEQGRVQACDLRLDAHRGEPGQSLRGWVRPSDLELAQRLTRLRPRRDRGVLLSPFDPVLWDRKRVAQLFAFDQSLEIYKPAAQRKYGYFCLPVLAGESLVGRVDLKVDRRSRRLRVLSVHFEEETPSSASRQAMETALDRHAAALVRAGLVDDRDTTC